MDERPVIPDRPGVVIEAWRCEHCRKLFPPPIAATVVLIDEVATKWTHSGAVASKGRFARRMVVCPPCRRSITGGNET